VETSVTRAVSEAMTQIHTDISKVSDTITRLEGKFSSFSTDVTSKVEAQSNRINTMEEQLSHLQSEIEDMKTLKDSTMKLLTENILQKENWSTIWFSRLESIVFA